MRYLCDMKCVPRKMQAERCAALLESVNLTAHCDQKIRTFSGGMRQRLGLAQALINRPRILVLDEPTAGLDPKERVRFRNLVRRLSDEITVIFCTHSVSDIETVAKEVLLLHHGRLLAKDTVPALVQKMAGKVWEVIPDADALEALLDRYPRSCLVSRSGETALRIASDKQPAPDAQPCKPNLEDVYLYLFGDDGV